MLMEMVTVDEGLKSYFQRVNYAGGSNGSSKVVIVLVICIWNS